MSNNSLSYACHTRCGNYYGDKRMDSLRISFVTIVAVVVGLMPGLAIRSIRSIARLIYRVLGPLSEAADKPGRQPAYPQPVGVAAPHG